MITIPYFTKLYNNNTTTKHNLPGKAQDFAQPWSQHFLLLRHSESSAQLTRQTVIFASWKAGHDHGFSVSKKKLFQHFVLIYCIKT